MIINLDGDQTQPYYINSKRMKSLPDQAFFGEPHLLQIS